MAATTFHAGAADCPIAARMRDMSPSAIRRMLAVSTQPGMISFAGGLPAPDLFDTLELARAFEATLKDDAPLALQYGATTGSLPVREQISAIMSRRGAEVAPDSVIVTTGAQQGLDLAARTLLNPGDIVFVERPTYTTALQTLRMAEALVLGVTCDQDGMVPTALVEAAAHAYRRGLVPKAVYLIPSFSNPSGVLVSEVRRRELLTAAAKLGLVVIEDDPYGDLYFEEVPPPSLLGIARELDASAPPLVYLGSLSKIVSPGMRVGWMVAPPALLPPLTIAKQSADLQSSTVTQHAAARYLSSGALERRLPVLRTTYAQRARQLCDALAAAIPNNLATFRRPQGGMFVWMSLAEGMDAERLVEAAIARGVVFVPGGPFFADNPSAKTLRLTFATASEAQILEGAQRLRRAIVSLEADHERNRTKD